MIASTAMPQDQAQQATEVGPARVLVQRFEPIAIGEGRPWKNVPDYLKEAKIYEKPLQERNQLQFSAEADGLVLMAASWTYDGNASGGWQEGNRGDDRGGGWPGE